MSWTPPALSHSPCAHNPERSNFTGLGMGPCKGQTRYVTKVIEGITARFYCCQAHAERTTP